MRKTLFFILMLSFSFFPLGLRARAQEKIDDFQVKVTVNKDGTIDVEEEILYNFGKEFRHGIFRKIPLVKKNAEGKRFLMRVTDLSVEDSLGETIKYENIGNDHEIHLKIGDPNKKITGSHKYLISYQVSGALTYFDDFDELYWNVTGSDRDVAIQNAFVRVILPEEVPSEEIEFVCYTGRLGEASTNCQGTQQIAQEVSIRTTQALAPEEGLTIAVTFPKGYVDILEPQAYKTPLETYLIYGGIGLILFLGNIVLPLIKLKSMVGQRKRLKNNLRVVAAWFNPPKTPNGEELSPGEMLGLLEKISPKVLTAEIVYLAQQGYLHIKEDGKKDFIFEKTEKGTKDLEEHQKIIYKGLFGNKTSISTKNIRKSGALGSRFNDVRTATYKQIQEAGLSEKNISKKRSTNGLIGFFSLFLGGLVNSLVHFIAAARERPLTDAGIQAYSEGLSLKNFLSSQEDQMDFQAEKQLFFEKLLPYATAFGVEKVWAKRFEGLNVQPPDWYEGQFDPGRLAIMTAAVNRSVSKSVSTSNRSSSGFSSGSSGGFSGGGGGGGSVGSW